MQQITKTQGADMKMTKIKRKIVLGNNQWSLQFKIKKKTFKFEPP